MTQVDHIYLDPWDIWILLFDSVKKIEEMGMIGEKGQEWVLFGMISFMQAVPQFDRALVPGKRKENLNPKPEQGGVYRPLKGRRIWRHNNVSSSYQRKGTGNQEKK